MSNEAPTDALRLVPCPFCGGDVINTRSQEMTKGPAYYWHKCETCGAESEGDYGEDVAVAAWNRRAAPASPLPGGGNEALIAELKEARGLLAMVSAQARVGYGDKPVLKSKRINLPAVLWHQVNAFLGGSRCNAQVDAEELKEARRLMKPFAVYYEINDLDERAADDAIEVPVGDLRLVRAFLARNEKG